MKVYTNGYLGYSGEFDVSGYLRLKDDNRFYYGESWTSYGGGASGGVSGTWRQSGDTLFFLAESHDYPLSLDFAEGRELTATLRGDVLDFGGCFTFTLERDDEPAPAIEPAAAPPQAEKAAPAAEQTVKTPEKPAPIAARFHFKDGRIVEKQLPPDPLFGLFTQSFYRFVDENGRATHFFRLREKSPDADSSTADFDEIDVASSEESDDFED